MDRLTWLVFMTMASFALAVFTGIIGFAYVSFIPASVLAYSMLSNPPSGVFVERQVETRRLGVGQEATVRVKLRVEKGVGFVIVGDVVPPGLEVLGKNRHVFFKKPGHPLEVEYEYRVKARKKGSHSISPIEVVGKDFLGIKPSTYSVWDKEVVIEAYPRVHGTKRAVLPKLRTKEKMTSSHTAPLGSVSTDFKEIREYRPGDPLKTINWKATARLNKVLVNEYEPEGRATVMVYLDTSENMAVGGVFQGSLESSIGLAISLINLLLRNDFRVGLYLVGSRKMLTPRSGVQALSTFSKLLLSVGPSIHRDDSLPLAVEHSRFSVGGNVTVSLFITNLTPYTLDDIKAAVNLARKSFGSKVVVVDVNPYGHFGDHQLVLSALQKEKLSENLRAEVVHWNPLEESLTVALKKIIGGALNGR
ncbi:DUF58 domain-containing protein [Thermococcus sp. ES12]|uniref:DUF58 domain-containing protein n=1 Tax=Thermococcus sp. ES12 TaxID=1638246 RepID=UPI001430C7F9|nr:DUF58 domain-containing protein [Thermococcus sp. ES12]NJE77360.1 DUF58 domain-containing protein [Thermococcus sp. ES12]